MRAVELIKSKKWFLGLASVMSSTSLFAVTGSGASTALNDEIIGISQTAGLVLFMTVILAFIAIPIAGMFFAKGIAKKKAEQQQEEAGGLMTMVWAMGGGILGFFTVFIVIGFLGSMMDASGGTTIDLVKGNRFVISKVLGSILTKTETSLQR